ncbi:hypothetical protein N9R79_11985 [Vibrio sp.]|nr:hypothetical protein [Vibrio sp.]
MGMTTMGAWKLQHDRHYREGSNLIKRTPEPVKARFPFSWE